MKPKLFTLLLLCLPLLLAACDPVSERHESTFWYVATTGSDSNGCAEPSDPCRTLAEALDRADEDDQINLAAGTYNEVEDPDGGFLNNISEIDFNVIISGAGRASTIIDAGGAYGGIFIHDVDYANLRDFTIQNTIGDCVSVVASSSTRDVGRASTTTIQNVTATACEDAGFRASGTNTSVTLINVIASSNGGDGATTYDAEMIIRGGEFSDNQRDGISASGNSLTVDGAIIERNVLAGVLIGGGTANLTNLTISGNGGGVWVLREESSLTMTDSTVSDNVHAGIEIDAGSADLTNVTISGNSGSGGGGTGAISNVAGILVIRNSQITQNLFGGITNHEAGNLTVIETTIDQNSGAAALDNQGFAFIQNSLIDNNTSPQVAIGNLGDLTITNSTIRGNTGIGIAVEDGQLALSNVTISGNGRNGIWVLGEENSLTIADSTISDNGFTGITFAAGSANLTNVTISGNRGSVAGAPGAIQNDAGILVIRNSQITRNINGGIFNYEAGDLSIIETTIAENSGDPVLLNLGFANIENSLIANNVLPSRITGSDAAVSNSGDLTISNSTISGNQGVGVTVGGGGALSLSYVTIAENRIGLNAHRGGEVVSLIANSLIVKNGGWADCVFGSGFPAPALAGVNIDSDDTCGFPSTYSATEIRLGELSNNGGPTFTHALLVRSPAINAARGSCPGNDQRLIPRPFGADCDVGAYEAGAVLSATATSGEISALILEDARCRTGPGLVYPDFDFFEPGQTTIVKGRSADSNWYYVEAISYAGNCWIGDAVLQFNVDADVLLSLPIINPPPTPTPTLDPDESYDTTPTPTACPTLINKPGSCK